ncbi:MAG: GGDEF domain-containing protein, partial [Shewanella sp.]
NLASFMLDELPREFDGIQHILSRPIYWPDGSVFGGLCVLNPHLPQAGQHEAMLEPFQILLQQDLTVLCQNCRIESLSMRDQETGLLNRYGFMLMAPRQLNLSRRFGAHAGIIFFELAPLAPWEAPQAEDLQANDLLDEKHHRLLANLLQNTIRTADIAAHYQGAQFAVLVFVDNERDVLQIIKRTEKLLEQHNQHLKLDVGYSFFSPSASVKLPGMIDAARNKLKSQHSPTQAQLSIATA